MTNSVMRPTNEPQASHLRPVVEVRLQDVLVLEPGLVELDPGEGEILLADVLEQLRDARRRDIVIFLDVESMGGHYLAGLALFHELRTCSEFGWPSVAYVRHAVSAAVPAVLGADYLVIDPGGGLAVHGMCLLGGPGELQSDELERELDAHARLVGSVIASRTLVPLPTARRWVTGLTTPEAIAGVELFRADRALELGFADLVGGRRAAEALAAQLSAGEPVLSPRQELLAARDVDEDLLEARRVGARASLFYGRPRPHNHRSSP